ncbi:MAG: Lrp/AsnC family transcriptional regulator, partial [Steroidobacteraceae bacterium]
MELDRLDARIVAELQKDGRRSVVELAEEIGLSGTPCARRIRLLEQAGVIQGYTAVVDPTRLGLK